MIFYYRDNLNPSAQIEKFSMPENFLIGFENFMEDISKRPKMGSSVCFIDFKLPVFDRNELIKLIDELKSEAGFRSAEEKKLDTFFERLVKIFSV